MSARPSPPSAYRRLRAPPTPRSPPPYRRWRATSWIEAALREDLPRIERDWAGREARRVDRDRMLLVVAQGVAGVALLAAAWWVISRRLRSEIRRTQAAQAEAEAARQDSERYLAFMTHEVRNSLQSVSRAVDLLHRRASGDPALLAALGRSARATLGLVDGLPDRHRPRPRWPRAACAGCWCWRIRRSMRCC